MQRPILFGLVSLLTTQIRADGPRVHTVFCAECTNNFDYKSLGVFWSHRLSGMPGNVTRLLACDENQLATYKGLNLGPTFVHRNHGRVNHMRDDKGAKPPYGSRPSDISPSYNKPGSIMHWVQESEEAKHVDYVLYIDADMLLRLPMDPVKMGVKPGVVVSEHVGYLDTGLQNGLQYQFLPKEQADISGADVNDHRPTGPDGKRHAAGGWYHFFHMDDIRKIAHRWLYYCEKMRLNPQLYWKMLDPKTGLPGGTDHDILTGDAYVSHGTAPWISEMYGYVFAAGEAGLRHILTHGVVVYPDDIGAGQPQEPSIIHYGLHCTVGSFHFTKYTHGMFDAVGCTGETFGDPPLPGHLERLCAETVLTLNDAMCDYYARDKQHGGCGFPEIGRTVPTCPAWKAPKMRSCSDKHEECKGWASSGECTKNPGFMLGACPKACDQCGVAGMVKVPAWARGYALANGEAAPYMRGVFDGPVPVNSEPGISLEGAGTVVRESGWATASKLTGSLTSRLRAAGKASGAKLRGAGAGLDTADALEREAGAGGETRKKRKLHPMPGFNASGIGERKLPGLAYGEGNADAGGAGGALHGAAAEAARQEAAAQVLRDAAAASDGAASDGAAAAEFAASHANGGGNGSLATLRWQMYVGWAAILVLGAFMVGRKFCRQPKKSLPGPKRSF